MEPIRPGAAEELADLLAAAARDGKRISLGGASTKIRMLGRRAAADVAISTTGMTQILQYEPRDLTISVEAGMPFAALNRRIAEDGLMLPLDPPFLPATTIGGVVAANVSGPRRRLYGTSRDLVIGVRFATLEGKLVQSGGMVVKNAAGLEMGKLLIGSMGVLAAICSVNFRLAPRPACTRTFLFSHESLDEAVALRDVLMRGFLQPAAIDLLNPAAATRVGLEGHVVLAQASGSQSVVDRFSAEFPDVASRDGEDEDALWDAVREFTPAFLQEQDGGAIVRVSTTVAGVGDAVARLDCPVVARAGSGVVYGYFDDCGKACAWARDAAENGLRPVVEYVSGDGCGDDRWPVRSSDFTMIERIKQMFDPRHLLNPGRLYGRL